MQAHPSGTASGQWNLPRGHQTAGSKPTEGREGTSSGVLDSRRERIAARNLGQEGPPARARYSHFLQSGCDLLCGWRSTGLPLWLLSVASCPSVSAGA